MAIKISGWLKVADRHHRRWWHYILVKVFSFLDPLVGAGIIGFVVE